MPGPNRRFRLNPLYSAYGPIWPRVAISAGPPKKRLRQSLELLVGRFKIRVAMMDNFWRCTFEWFLGRNAVQPALFGKFFVRGKIQPHQQAHSPVRCCRRFFRGGRTRFCGSRFALSFFRCFSFGFLQRRCLGRRFRSSLSLDTRAVGTVQLVLQFLVEPKSLPPAVQLVPRLLRLLLVRAKVKSYVTVCHDSSLRRRAIQVKLEPSAGVMRCPSAVPRVRDSRDWRIV